MSSFASLSSTVKASMEGALTRILTPTRRVDLLADVQRARAEKRPHVIVFVGVNGVGKSTSLSKVRAEQSEGRPMEWSGGRPMEWSEGGRPPRAPPRGRSQGAACPWV